MYNAGADSLFAGGSDASICVRQESVRLITAEKQINKDKEKALSIDRAEYSNGGVAGIRTLGKLSPTQPFQDCTLNRSDTTPFDWRSLIIRVLFVNVKKTVKNFVQEEIF